MVKKTTAVKWLKGLAKRTKASNAAFAKASPADKRVTIAKDVIAALEAKQILPTHGEYFDGGIGEMARAKGIGMETGDYSYDALHPLRRKGLEKKSLQDILPEIPACHVCAKGAIFMTAVARQNEVTVGEGMRCQSQALSDQLRGLFDADQLELIECAFEGFNGYPVITGSGPKARMRNIMQNIVKNKGTFVYPRY